MIILNTDWLLFFGRFHPLIVHLPIGIILFLVVLKIVAPIAKFRIPKGVTLAGLGVASLSALFAVVTGVFLSNAGGYDRETLLWHKWIGLIMAVMVTLALLLQLKGHWDLQLLKTNLSTWSLVASVVLIISGAHLGAKMTHGRGYLTRYMPSVFKNLFSTSNHAQPEQKHYSKPLDSIKIFSDVVKPILERKCVGCHNTAKSMGDLVLSSEDGILKGGRGGKAIERADWEKSEILRRINLPQTSERFMPTDSNEPLNHIEKSLLRWWLERGSSFEDNIYQLDADARFRYLLSSYIGYGDESSGEAVLPVVKPADDVLLRSLRDLGLMIRPLNSESNLLDVSFILFQKKTTDHVLPLLKQLTGLRDQLYKLDLKYCKLDKQAVEIISRFHLLDKLNIYGCEVADDMVLQLSSLKQLSSLNIAQNPVTDKSVKAFKQLPALVRINIWQTGITKTGSKDLSGSMPGLTIIENESDHLIQ